VLCTFAACTVAQIASNGGDGERKNVENYFLWQRCLFALELWKSNHPYRVSWKTYQCQQINIDALYETHLAFYSN